MLEKTEIRIMERLIKAGKILGIEVLDFVVVGDNDYTSFHQLGLD